MVLFRPLALGIPLLLAACAGRPDVVFTDVSDAAGLRFRYTFGDTTYQNILESSGSGVSVFDYDGDGWLDLFLLNGTYLGGISEPHGRRFAGSADALYRNNGDGTFTETAAAAGLDDRHWSMAASVLDYDGDGDVDVFLSNYGPNVFFQNNGDGTFTDVTDRIGLRGPDSLNGFVKWSVGGVFWDADADGLTDLMVCNFLAFDPLYVSPETPELMPHPNEYRGQASLLYLQQTDGSFRETTREWNLYRPDSKCMGLTLFDYDEDGDLDLFQGNDHQPNFLFRYEAGVLRDVARQAGVAGNDRGLPTGSMHGSIGDVDGDLHVDLLVTDLEYGALYRYVGNGAYEDVTRVSGIAAAFDGKGQWASGLFDFDNDRDLDLFAANGTAEELVLQLPLLLANDGSGRFTDVGPERSAYFQKKRSGRGAATFDYDNDGDLDLVFSHLDGDGRAVLLRNDGGNRNHWLGLTLQGAHGPASAIGARVTASAGGKSQTAVYQNATSYLSYNDPRLHLGLGSAATIDRLEVAWSSGHRDGFENVPADRYVVIREGGALSEAPARTTSR